MSLNLQKKLEEKLASESGTMSLSQCMNKHAEEFAKAAAEKRLRFVCSFNLFRVTRQDSVQEFTGQGTRTDQPAEPVGENHFVKPQQQS